MAEKTEDEIEKLPEAVAVMVSAAMLYSAGQGQMLPAEAFRLAKAFVDEAKVQLPDIFQA